MLAIDYVFKVEVAKLVMIGSHNTQMCKNYDIT